MKPTKTLNEHAKVISTLACSFKLHTTRHAQRGGNSSQDR